MGLAEDELLVDIAHKKDLLQSPSGDLQSIKGINNLKEALLRRLITVPGALIHRPDYGVGIQEFLNDPNSLAVKEQIALRVKEQFELDSRVQKVVGLRFTTADEDSPSRIILFVKIDISGFGEVELDFQVS